MAANPMQRRARQSFLLGAMVTLLLALIVIFFLYNHIRNLNEKITEQTGKKTQVYVLNQDVRSGQTLTADMFISKSVDANTVPANATSDIYSTLAAYALADESGNTIYTTTDSNGKEVMFIDYGDGNKQVITSDANTGKLYKNGQEIKTTEKPLMAKIDLKANTVITGSMIERADDIVKDDSREQTYNMISLPIDLYTGDYVDIRLMLPNGTDFIVLSKLKVTIPDVNGVPMSNTIKVNINEEELLTMSSAIVEAYKIEGAKLYAIKYVEAGNQNAAVITYEPRADIKTLIKNNPNIVEEAMTKLYTNLTNSYRKNQIDKYFNSGNDESIISGIQESTQETQKAREDYLSSLYGM